MKNLLFLLLPFCCAFVIDDPIDSLNGSFKMTKKKFGGAKEWTIADERLDVKVFKDGYWFNAKLHPGNKEFNGICGGRYDLKNGKYNETVDYYSWDSSAVGSIYTMEYKITNEEYHQYGKMNSAKWFNYDVNEVRTRLTVSEPLKDNSLEGVWLMKEGYWEGTGRLGEGKYRGFSVIKIFAYPLVVFAYYDAANKKFDGGGVARYQFDGQNLTEIIELWSWNMAKRGKTETHKIILKNGQLIQEGWEGKLREVFAKIN